MVCSHLIYPLSPQVIFEATVSEERQGYIALDDIVLLNYPCCKYPLYTAHSIPADLFWAQGKWPAEQTKAWGPGSFRKKFPGRWLKTMRHSGLTVGGERRPVYLVPVRVWYLQEASLLSGLHFCLGRMADLFLWSLRSQLGAFKANVMLQAGKGQLVVVLWSSLGFFFFHCHHWDIRGLELNGWR